MSSSAGSRIGPGTDWVGTAAEMAATGVGMFRKLVEVVGVLTVVAVMAFALAPGIREAALQAFSEGYAAARGSDGAADADADGGESAGAIRLQPAEESVAQYLSRRYHVADEAVRPLVAAARDAGHETNLDPLAILAVMAVESSMNPFAESRVGAQGLMQVMTGVHADRLAREQANALDPGVNIRMGSQILGELVRRGGSLERGLKLYVGAGNLPDDGGYAARVLAEMSRLKTAAGGDVAGALAAGQRADAKQVNASSSGVSTSSAPAAASVVAASDS